MTLLMQPVFDTKTGRQIGEFQVPKKAGKILWLDTETYSETPIKRGTAKYMADPSFEIMLVTYAIGDGPVKLWDRTATEQIPADLLDALLDAGQYRIAAHNGVFDRQAFLHDDFLPEGVDLRPERWICTMIQAYAHGLPGGLDKLCDIFGINQDDAKDKGGKQLIHLFCKPNRGKRATPATHPEQWDRFCDYARKDISAMRAVHAKLPKWNYPGVRFVSDWEPSDDHRLWCRDCRVNERGFHLDLHLCEAAIVCAEEEKVLLDSKTTEATDGAVTAATQRDKMLAFILESHDVTLPDMRADTLKRRIEDENLPVAVRYLLELRMQSAKNSSSKYTRGVESAVDGRMKFSTQFMGAPATGRKAGRIIQPQNFARPTMKLREIEEAITAVKRGYANFVYPNVPEMLGNTIRGIIISKPGHKLVASDLSAIEGRSLAWLARDERVVQFYRDYDDDKISYDSYLLAYAQTFGEDPSTMSKHTHAWERQLGKPIELSCFAANTRVLTDNGVKRIADVTLEDKLWDGMEWVSHAGLVDRGVKLVVSVDGIEVTPDHLINTQGTWLPAQVLASNESTLCQALATGSDSLRSLASSTELLAVSPSSVSAAVAAQLRIASSTTTCATAKAPAATRAQNSKVTLGESSISATPTSCPTPTTDADCSAAWPQQSTDAKTHALDSTIPTAGVASASTAHGSKERVVSKVDESGCATSSACQAGTTPNLSSTDATTTAATSQAICASSPASPTRTTSELSNSCNSALTNSKPVYDLAHAGPRNRFTIFSDSGALVVHNCGYGGGVAAFLTFAMVYHIDLEATAERIWAVGDEGLLRECEQKYDWAKKNRYHAGLDKRTYAAFEYIKQGWRAARQPTVEWWELLADGFRNATLYPERTFHARSVAFRRDGAWLRLRLPSGRCLCFVNPRVDSKGLSFMGLDRYTRRLGRIYTHGGKIAGWVTQAFARDVLFHNAEGIEEAGYPIVLDVHDELITEPEDTDDFNVAGLNALITANKPWNEGLPLRAGGFEAYRYRKD